MSFINEYPTQKTEQELRMELESLIRRALKETAEERTEGLVLTSEQIEKIVSRVRELDFTDIKKGAATLDGITQIILQDSDDPVIQAILKKQKEIYDAKQAEFRKSEEHTVAQEVYQKHPDVMEKIMLAFDIASCEEKEDGSVEMHTKCDESRLISGKNDNAVIKIIDGKMTIKVAESKNSQKDVTR